MNAKPFLLSFAVFYSVISYSQNYLFSSAESIGRAGTGVAIDNYSSVFINPSGVAKQKMFSLSVGYLLPYSTEELSVRQLSFVVPVKVGALVSIVRQYGNDFYKESQFSLGFVKSLSPYLRASFQLQYLQIYQSYESAGQLYSSLGFQTDLSKELTIGIYISNPEHSVVHFSDECIPVSSFYHMGFLWKANENVRVMYEVEKETDVTLLHCFGFDYSLSTTITVRCGVLGKPIHYSMGSSVRIGRFQIDTGVLVHQVLGMSSSIALRYHFNS